MTTYTIYENLGNKTYLFTPLAKASYYSYHWDFGDTTTIADTSNSMLSSYTYTNAGSYRVRLKIKDNNTKCTDGSSALIDVSVGENNTHTTYNANVYPNPVTELSKIYFNADKNNSSISLHLYDLTGRKINSYVNNLLVNAGQNSIPLTDLESLAPSIYILQLVINNEVLNFQLIK